MPVTIVSAPNPCNCLGANFIEALSEVAREEPKRYLVRCTRLRLGHHDCRSLTFFDPFGGHLMVLEFVGQGVVL